jgi:hypothetical protein
MPLTRSSKDLLCFLRLLLFDALVQFPHVNSAVFQGFLGHGPRACPRLAPDQRQMLKVMNRLHSGDRTSQLRTWNPGGTNRNNFIRQERLKTNPWTPIVAPEQPEPDMLFSNLLEHLFRVPNDEPKADLRVATNRGLGG